MHQRQKQQTSLRQTFPTCRKNPIVVMLSGRSMCCGEEQPLKALLPIVVIPSGSSTSVRDVHWQDFRFFFNKCDLRFPDALGESRDSELLFRCLRFDRTRRHCLHHRQRRHQHGQDGCKKSSFHSTSTFHNVSWGLSR